MKSAITAIVAGISLAACAAGPVAPGGDPSRSLSSHGPTEFATQKLKEKGLEPKFMELILEIYREDQRKTVLELNLLGFLRSNQATGSETIPGWEIDRVQKFLNSHRSTFKLAERQFQVRKEVIASLLWVETKHGKDLGTFHVSSALLSLVEGAFPTLFDQLVESAKQKAANFDKPMETRLQERALKKSDWAAGELVALQEIHKRGWKNVRKLNGSFSGAFGMAQFVPSSYLSWAKSKKKRPNLFRADDSILSVANYLQSNGWLQESREAQEGALFHYNRDRAYVAHILRMSECLRNPLPKTKRPKRSTASAKSC